MRKIPIRRNKKYCRQHRFGNSGAKSTKSTLCFSILILYFSWNISASVAPLSPSRGTLSAIFLRKSTLSNFRKLKLTEVLKMKCSEFWKSEIQSLNWKFLKTQKLNLTEILRKGKLKLKGNLWTKNVTEKQLWKNKLTKNEI